MVLSAKPLLGTGRSLMQALWWYEYLEGRNWKCFSTIYQLKMHLFQRGKCTDLLRVQSAGELHPLWWAASGQCSIWQQNQDLGLQQVAASVKGSVQQRISRHTKIHMLRAATTEFLNKGVWLYQEKGGGISPLEISKIPKNLTRSNLTSEMGHSCCQC